MSHTTLHTQRPRGGVWAALLGISAVVSGGCQSSPEPPAAQAPPPPTIVQVEDASRAAISADMMVRFADTAARELAVKLPETVASQPTKVVLAFAPISNQASLDNRTLSVIDERLRTRLTSAESIQGSFIVISEPYASSQDLLQGFQPATTGVFDPTGTGATEQPSQYDSALLYFLQLSANEAVVGRQRKLNLTVRFSHPQSRRDLLAATLDTTLVWRANAGGWVVTDQP